jgi:hypothetical protein
MTKPISAFSSSGPTAPPYAISQGLMRLPPDVLRLILKYLDPVSFNMALRSCKTLKSLCQSLNNPPLRFKSNYAFYLEAAKHGYLGILKWFYDKQSQQNKTEKLWNEYTCSVAAERGHLEVLQWLREKGYPWNKLTCTRAARNGHLHILQWARQNSCPWNKDECLTKAKEQGHLLIVKWIEENDKV